MKRNFQSFTNNNHAKRCRLLMPRMHKPGWRETHTFQKKLLKSCHNSHYNWWLDCGCFKNIFRGTILRMDLFWVSMVITFKTSYGEHGIFLLSHTTSFVIIHYGTNNVNQNQPKDCQNIKIIKVVKTFTKKYAKVNNIITGIL